MEANLRNKMSRVIKMFLFSRAMTVVFLFQANCSSLEQAEFVGQSKYEISKIDEKHGVVVAYGAAPIKISLQKVYERLSLTPPGKSPQILYLIDPSAITTSFNPEPLFDATKYDSVGQHSTEIDLILRCHRYIMYGLHVEAEGVIAELESKRGVSGLTMELRQLMANMSGNDELARLYRDLAAETRSHRNVNTGVSKK